MESLINDLRDELSGVSVFSQIKEIENKYLGKDGLIKAEIRKVKDLPEAERKEQGPKLQNLLKQANELIGTKKSSLEDGLLQGDLKKEAEDIGFNAPKIGHLHPITEAVNSINSLFFRMGYSIYDAGEIETDEYNFERLNVPKDHPAREMQDTIYIKAPEVLLRTQTSSIEARALAELKPPFRIVCPGRVYRNEKANQSNHFIFHQYQGVVVEEKVSLKDLFATFTMLFKQMYGDDVVVRFRNKYYPEVEPGVGLDMRCFNCKGKGCQVCKKVGWIEMGGSGIIHEKVLRAAGLDPNKWMGFAFGLGLDRWVMAKYNITDIRTLLGGNIGYKYHRNTNIFSN